MNRQIIVNEEVPLGGVIAEIIGSILGGTLAVTTGMYLNGVLPAATTTFENVARGVTIGLGSFTVGNLCANGIEQTINESRESLIAAKLAAKGLITNEQLALLNAKLEEANQEAAAKAK